MEDSKIFFKNYMTQLIRVRETKDLQDATLQSIISWASSRNRVPDATNTDTGFKKVAKNDKDAWYQDLLYLYDANLAASTSKDNICGRRSTSLKLDPGTGTALNDIAFVILSRADNTNNTAFKSIFTGALGGDPAHVSGTTIKLTSNVTPSGTANGTISVSGTNPDIVRWVTLDELRSKIGCQGAPLKIVNNELPSGAVPTPYSATLTADGGTGSSTFKWCVSMLPSGITQSGGVQSANCLSLNEAGWAVASPNLVISFLPVPPVAPGAHQITVVVRDNADGSAASNPCDNANPGDNCAQKVFVLTVNPQ